MNRDSIGLAVAEAAESQSEHYLVDCPRCRHGIKVRVDELRKRLPTDYVLPTPPPRPTPISVKKGDERAEKPPAAGPVPKPTANKK
jgi:hypothetical protein